VNDGTVNDGTMNDGTMNDSAGVLAGVPGSPGVYTGPVRVIRGPADFGRLRAGDVLVCPTTDPAWSLLFGVAGALVTDGGNVLSHAAIVAREHAIPAVVGTGGASRTLRDGQVVTVDGTAGRVRLAEAWAERPAATST
jgi:pyruvate,water dikinase